jgi:ribonuclease P protein component
MSETSFSTPQPPPREASRVPSPNGDEGRAGGAQGAPPEGPAPPGSLTWRTRGRSAFEGLRRADTVRSGPFTLSWLPAVPGQPPALAFAIGKRVGNAVVRNRLRRRLREAARQLVTLPPGTYLIRARPGPWLFPSRKSQPICRERRAPCPLREGRCRNRQQRRSG